MLIGFVVALVVWPLRAHPPKLRASEFELKPIVDVIKRLVASHAVADLSTELQGAQVKFAARLDPDDRVVAMGELLRVLATTEGGQNEAILTCATPFAEELVAYSPAVPTAPPVLRAQLRVFFGILAESTFADPESNHLRESRVRELITVWNRAELTWTSYADLDTEALATGDADAPLVPLPESLRGAVIPGMGPEAIEDAGLRREYEAYLAAIQETNLRIGRAFELADLRQRYLRHLRRYLSRLYSNKPAESTELLGIVTQVFKDESRANDFLESLTEPLD